MKSKISYLNWEKNLGKTTSIGVEVAGRTGDEHKHSWLGKRVEGKWEIN